MFFFPLFLQSLKLCMQARNLLQILQVLLALVGLPRVALRIYGEVQYATAALEELSAAQSLLQPLDLLLGTRQLLLQLGFALDQLLHHRLNGPKYAPQW